MSREVKVLVVDSSGYGVYSKEVYTYQNSSSKQATLDDFKEFCKHGLPEEPMKRIEELYGVRAQ